MVFEKEDKNEERIEKPESTMQYMPDEDEYFLSAPSRQDQPPYVGLFWLHEKGYAARCGRKERIPNQEDKKNTFTKM